METLQFRIWKKRRTDSYNSTWKKILLCQKRVFLERHPYFWKSRFFMWRSLSTKLLLGHGKYLSYGLCFTPICNPCPDLKSLSHRFVVRSAKFLFLAALPNSVGKLCRSSYCMYISLNSSETILKQNMEQTEEAFMLLALLTMCLSDSLIW